MQPLVVFLRQLLKLKWLKLACLHEAARSKLLYMQMAEPERHEQAVTPLIHRHACIQSDRQTVIFMTGKFGGECMIGECVNILPN